MPRTRRRPRHWRTPAGGASAADGRAPHDESRHAGRPRGPRGDGNVEPSVSVPDRRRGAAARAAHRRRGRRRRRTGRPAARRGRRLAARRRAHVGGARSAARPSAPDGCCSAPTCAATSSASSSSATRPCRGPSRASSATRVSRCSPCGGGRRGHRPRPGRPRARRRAAGRGGPTTRPGSTPGVSPTTAWAASSMRDSLRPKEIRREPPGDGACRRSPSRRSSGGRGRSRHDARRGLVQPRARPRRHGHPMDAARAPLRRRQPWTRRHRRHGVDRGRRRARPTAGRSHHRLPRRPDLPARHERPAHRAAASARPDLTFVVLSDDGGAIFSTLEQGDRRYARAFERVFATPHGTDLGRCARRTTRHTSASTTSAGSPRPWPSRPRAPGCSRSPSRGPTAAPRPHGCASWPSRPCHPGDGQPLTGPSSGQPVGASGTGHWDGVLGSDRTGRGDELGAVARLAPVGQVAGVLQADAHVVARGLGPAQHRPGPAPLAVHEDRHRRHAERGEDALGRPRPVGAGGDAGDELDEHALDVPGPVGPHETAGRQGSRCLPRRRIRCRARLLRPRQRRPRAS